LRSRHCCPCSVFSRRSWSEGSCEQRHSGPENRNNVRAVCVVLKT
jgi:hypothetical protein